jgi:hypothetical protein
MWAFWMMSSAGAAIIDGEWIDTVSSRNRAVVVRTVERAGVVLMELAQPYPRRLLFAMQSEKQMSEACIFPVGCLDNARAKERQVG